MDLNLTGKTALVTGGCGGLGLAVARGLGAEGAGGVIVDRLSDADARDAIGELDGWSYLRADLSDAASTEAVFARAVELAGELDILVSCAAVWPTALVRDMSLAEWERTLFVDLTAAFVLSRDFLRSRSSGGVIVNVVSQAAFGGATSGHAHYAAAKAGLVNLTRTLARESAGTGARVNAVAPGMMRTAMAADALADREEAYVERIPLGRIADPSEVADVVVFLCSERAGYMTGATVDVSGGMLMH